MKEYIYIACRGDNQIIDFFDPTIPVSSPEEAADRIWDKLVANYPESNFVPLHHNGEKIGFYAWVPGLLISFGVNIEYRTKDVLTEVWDGILREMGDGFSVVLYTKNTRAIQWLERCGMRVFGENLTILIHAKKENICPQEVCCP